MNSAEILASLRASGKVGTAKIFRRHGATGEVLGVLYSDMTKLQKRIRCDHAMAKALWASGVHEAKVLATLVADPAKATRVEIDGWLKACDSYPMVDAFTTFVARTPHAEACVKAWLASKHEWTSSAAWGLVSRAAQEPSAQADELFEAFLHRIEQDINAAPNRTRHSMNGALIGIGSRNDQLRDQALASARRIGKVEVDHGATDCETPDATAYILKIWARRAKQAKG